MRPALQPASNIREQRVTGRNTDNRHAHLSPNVVNKPLTKLKKRGASCRAGARQGTAGQNASLAFFSLREVKQIMNIYDPTGTKVRQFKMALDKSEKQLARLQKQRALIDDAIDEIGTLMSTARGLLAGRAPNTQSNRLSVGPRSEHHEGKVELSVIIH
ncbi:hypothetical protein [Manganibacter manganicus]|uniref:Uncharacterized protein n=1 Tax=Manganibacter manganicus TaxID=1873176 RepID=A0A1V8RKC9_9HYPH|nr:hypothetical protein [Pseudaminobacter manganicus]OQM73675.1 hypothetical protein BFN67_07085 [Pseudaminobacter manganicus]